LCHSTAPRDTASGFTLLEVLVALSIVLLVGALAWKARGEHRPGSLVARLTLAWLGLICLQAALGASTVWSNKAADVATAHVMVGALSLLTGTILSGLMVTRQAHSNTDSEYALSLGETGSAILQPASVGDRLRVVP